MTNKGGAATPQAWNLPIRAAVKAALFTLKNTSKKHYNQLMGQVQRGKTAFVNWYEGPSGAKVRGILRNLGLTVSGAALYDAIRWVIGI